MKKQTALLLALAVSAGFLSGCATQHNRYGSNVSLLGGAVAVNTNHYLPARASSASVDLTKVVGTGNPSGNEYSLLWGFISFSDY